MDITRDELMDAEGARERPDISPLVLSSPWEARMVPVGRILQTVKTTWNAAGLRREQAAGVPRHSRHLVACLCGRYCPATM